mmetsp:Transcript_31789/g.96097  ORF Transcript_31789/g.96097 Transcript_31789/m.96097 type:complete len:236 (-) Transcript_31789:739-1446(-)
MTACTSFVIRATALGGTRTAKVMPTFVTVYGLSGPGKVMPNHRAMVFLVVIAAMGMLAMAIAGYAVIKMATAPPSQSKGTKFKLYNGWILQKCPPGCAEHLASVSPPQATKADPQTKTRSTKTDTKAVRITHGAFDCGSNGEIMLGKYMWSPKSQIALPKTAMKLPGAHSGTWAMTASLPSVWIRSTDFMTPMASITKMATKRQTMIATVKFLVFCKFAKHKGNVMQNVKATQQR